MSDSTVRAPLPVTVVTGALGAGKTSLIARLMASKPPGEHWVVLLNEFTETGIDALTVAAVAQGSYDVRLVAGGCLCCTGEQDFRRNLRELLATGACDRLIVEPSGAGHPAGMVEELLAHQSHGALRVEAILGLIDPPRLASGEALEPGLTRDQLDIADVLVLAKPDLATPGTADAMQELQQSLYPPRPVLMGDRIDPQLLAMLAMRERQAGNDRNHADDHVHDHDHARDRVTGAPIGEATPPREVELANGLLRSDSLLLGRGAASWVLPRGRAFNAQRLRSLLEGTDPQVKAAQRIKGVFQVGEDEWLLVQRSASGMTATPSAWRRDSRVEVLADSGTDWSAWDALWQQCRSNAD